MSFRLSGWVFFCGNAFAGADAMLWSVGGLVPPAHPVYAGWVRGGMRGFNR